MFKKFIPLVAVMAITTACTGGGKSNADLASNPFVNPAETYMASPDFNSIKIEHYLPAFEEGIRQHEAEIDSIANNPEPATFENTLVALEKSGRVLSRVSSVFFALTSADTNDELIAIEEEITPKLSAHSDALYLNDKLFERVKAIHDGDLSSLEPEDQRLVKHYYDNFVQAGALLSSEDKEQLKTLNQKEAALLTDFGNKLTKATNAFIFIKDKAQLTGLSEEQLKSASDLAEKEGHNGEYAFSLVNTTQQDIMVNLDVRETRKLFYDASIKRCIKGDEYDTQKIVLELAKVRADKAKLLGLPNYAAWKLQDQLAAKPENVITMLTNLAKLADPKAKSDQAELESFARKTMGADFSLEAWDWSYYAEKLRKSKFDINENDIKPYFHLDSVVKNGIFYMAKQLYNIDFIERNDLPVYAEGVKIYDVLNQNKERIALFYTDYYRRATKGGGAWMSNWVSQSHLLGKRPIIYNVCNFAPPINGETTLLNMDEVMTVFHEFGHALHGMLSNCKYNTLSGTAVSRDFVEMPSQFNESFASIPEVFNHYARHYKTNEPMPDALREKMLGSLNFLSAYALGENLAATSVDLAWHCLSPSEVPTAEEAPAFEKKVLADMDLLNNQIPPRYSTSYFNHIWGGGYAAGYYSYLWSEVLAANIADYFEAHGALTRKVGDDFRQKILSRGNTRDLIQIFSDFTGLKAPDTKGLLKARGM